MDTIFIDTSIFESNNFLESNRIKEVYKLAERGEIKVVVPRLTYDEIINRISKNIDEVDKKFEKYRNDTRILRNIPSISHKNESIDCESIKKEINEIMERTFREAKIEIIEYPTLNIEEIFKSYFGKKFPFGDGGKKNEFPDAFALKTIEVWAKEKGIKVLVFSKDKDMLNFQSNYLEIVESFEEYLSEKIKEVELKHKNRINQIEDIIKNKPEAIQKKIENWAIDQLDDYSKYNEYSNYCDIHELEIIKVDIDIEDYKITNVTDDYISVELKIWINYIVQLVIDDIDYMFLDEDTREFVFLEKKPKIVDDIRYIETELIFEIDPSDDTVFAPEIETINKGRNLSV